MFTQPLIIGGTYRLKFKSIFERHGVCTTSGVTCLHQGGGVFRLEQITNFRDLNLAGIKLYDVFFEPLGISKEDYLKYFDGKPDDVYEPEYTTKVVENKTTEKEVVVDPDTHIPKTVEHEVVTQHEVYVETGRSLLKKHVDDSVSYAAYPIYKFVDVIDSTDVLYVPQLTIDGFPEISIREYRDLSLVFHLGYVDKPEILDPMLLAIRERMAIYGLKPSKIGLYCTGTKWMSPMEYEAIKLLRVPANVETITPEMREDMLGEMAIVDGKLKKIVVPDEETGYVDDPSTEVSIDAITSHKQVIDNRLFLVKCGDSDLFVTGDTYYTKKTLPSGSKTVVAWYLLKEGYDYAPGDPCITYELATAETPASVQRYKLVEGGYMAVARGMKTSYPKDVLLYKSTVIRDGGTPVDVYRAPTKEEIEDEDTILYVKKADSYEPTEDVTGTLYIKTDNVWRENYATIVSSDKGPGSLVLMGCTFNFKDIYDYERTMVIRLEDIIDFASQKYNVTLPKASLGKKYWEKYLGRKFRYIEYTNPNDSTERDTIEVDITEDSMELLSEKPGVILGQAGVASVDTYIKDSDKQKRNYYMQYVIQSKKVDALKVRVAMLEDALIQKSKQRS